MFHGSVFGELGFVLVIIALVMAFFMAVLPLLSALAKKQLASATSQHKQPFWETLANPFWYQLTVPLAYLLAGFMLVSFLCLIGAFYVNDFSLTYVVNHSNSLMPWYYKVSAAWGGHEGSLLLWASILAVWTGLVAKYSKPLPLMMRASVLAVLGAIQVSINALVLYSSSPFERSVQPLIVDGAELNPLLQDPGLIFHPPTLYIGYVGMAVPFAFAMAALLVGRLDAAWTRWTRPWVLAAWAFLTLGIAMGSWWAYFELGWGGWWFWDPVENASFLPWLAATALLHSLIVTEKRGVFKAWSVMLAIIAFAMSLLGTFLVRSGVLTSVHSFAADPERGLLILITLAIIIGSALFLFAVRGWKLSAESRYELRSRESVLAINNILIMVATVVVLLGTLYPIIADAFGLGQVSVGAPYFNAMFVPLTWIMLLFMGLSPIIKWKNHKRPLLSASITLGICAVVLAIIITLVLTGNLVSEFNVALTVALVCWVLLFIAKDIKHKTRLSDSLWQGIKRIPTNYWAMQLAHVGVLLSAIGICFNTALSVEKDVALKVGEQVQIAKQGIVNQGQAYRFTLSSVADKKQDNYHSIYANIDVTEVSGKNETPLTTLQPEKRTYLIQKSPMTEAAVSATMWRDLYVALGEPIDANDVSKGWAVRVYIKPFVRWIWFGAVVMALAGFLAMFDKRLRKTKYN